MRRSLALFAALLAAFLMIPLLLAAQEPARLAVDTLPRRLTLDEALRLAEGASETVGIARAARDRTVGEQRQARSGFLPQVGAGASYVRLLDSQFGDVEFESGDSTGGNPFGDLPFGQPNTWNLGLSLQQTVFDWRVVGRSRAAAAIRRTAELDLGVQRAQVVLDVATAYYDALLADRLVQIAESTLSQTERTLRDVELGHQVGTVPEYDVLRARVARDNQRPAVIQRRNDQEIAYIRLRQLLDLPQETPLVLASPIPSGDSLEVTPLPQVTAEFRESADTLGVLRAGVRASEEQVRAREGLYDEALGEALPVVSLGSDYGRIGFGSDVVPSWDRWVNDWSLSARVSLPLFTGGRLAGQREAAQADVRSAQLELRRAEELAVRDSVAVRRNVEAAEAAWSATRGTVAEAERAYQIAEIRFREGVSTQTELADARLAFERAGLTSATAARDVLVARLQESLLPWLPLGTATR